MRKEQAVGTVAGNPDDKEGEITIRAKQTVRENTAPVPLSRLTPEAHAVN